MMLDRQPFVTQVEGWPQRPFLSGAFAYDLVQWTQPIRVQHVPDHDALLAVFWSVDGALLVGRPGQSHRLHVDSDVWAEHAEPADVRVTAARCPTFSARVPWTMRNTPRPLTVKQAIVDGRMYQVNIGRRWTGPLDDEPWDDAAAA